MSSLSLARRMKREFLRIAQACGAMVGCSWIADPHILRSTGDDQQLEHTLLITNFVASFRAPSLPSFLNSVHSLTYFFFVSPNHIPRPGADTTHSFPSACRQHLQTQHLQHSPHFTASINSHTHLLTPWPTRRAFHSKRWSHTLLVALGGRRKVLSLSLLLPMETPKRVDDSIEA